MVDISKSKRRQRFIKRVSIILGLSLVGVVFMNGYNYGKAQTLSLDVRDSPKVETEVVVEVVQQDQVEETKVKMPKYDIPLSHDLQEYTWNLCQENNLSYEMILALMWQESKMNINAKSKKNRNGTYDEGIAQLNNSKSCREDHIKYSGITNLNPYNPHHNIAACIGVLKHNKDIWVNRGVADEFIFDYILNSYNMGDAGFRKYIKNTGKTNRKYSDNILEYKEQLEQHGKFLNT